MLIYFEPTLFSIGQIQIYDFANQIDFNRITINARGLECRCSGIEADVWAACAAVRKLHRISPFRFDAFEFRGSALGFAAILILEFARSDQAYLLRSRACGLAVKCFGCRAV